MQPQRTEASEKGKDTRFQNRIPLGVVQTPEYQALKAQYRHTLQTMANRGTKPTDQGHILDIWGGKGLMEDGDWS